MIHYRVAFSLDIWYHIVASSNVDTIAVTPNGIASIFMQSDKAPQSDQTHFVVFGTDIPNGNLGENIAMEKAIRYLETNIVRKQRVNVVRF